MKPSDESELSSHCKSADELGKMEENEPSSAEQKQRCGQVVSGFKPRILLYSKRAQHDTKLTKTLVIIVVTFCLCWTPYAVTIILELFLASPLPRAVSFSVLLLGYANSTCTVVIYVTSNGISHYKFKMAATWRKL